MDSSYIYSQIFSISKITSQIFIFLNFTPKFLSLNKNAPTVNLKEYKKNILEISVNFFWNSTYILVHRPTTAISSSLNRCFSLPLLSSFFIFTSLPPSILLFSLYSASLILLSPSLLGLVLTHFVSFTTNPLSSPSFFHPLE